MAEERVGELVTPRVRARPQPLFEAGQLGGSAFGITDVRRLDDVYSGVLRRDVAEVGDRRDVSGVGSRVGGLFS